MKPKLHLLTAAFFASVLSTSAWAQPANDRSALPETVSSKKTAAPGDPNPTPLGAEQPITFFKNIEVKNFQDETLGRIRDLAVDLVNGRIVVALLECDGSLGFENKKIVAVPPLALISDAANQVYRLNVSTEVFKTAAAVDLKQWTEAGQSARVAAAYHLFGQEPYFLEEGQTASKTDQRPKVAIGYVERTIKLLDMPVGNFQNEKLGKVWSLTFDIPQGRIRSVVVLAPGNFKTKSIVPAMALSFNDKRNALLLDDSKMEYADEPRYQFTEETYGVAPHSKEEAYQGPHTTTALAQGSSYRDVDRTVAINQEIRATKINGRNVQVGTMNGRVTLRGWVYSDVDKVRIGEIAIAVARVELVDNQITVGKPVTGN